MIAVLLSLHLLSVECDPLRPQPSDDDECKAYREAIELCGLSGPGRAERREHAVHVLSITFPSLDYYKDDGRGNIVAPLRHIIDAACSDD